MSQPFTLRRQVEFNHCDPAGIVFYPRYYEMISALVERFFADACGMGWGQMTQGGTGTPMGEIRIRFAAPSRLEDWLDLSLTVRAIGRASATFDLACHCAGELRFSGEATVIHATLGDSTAPGRALRWPEALRSEMSRYLSAPDQ